MPVQETGRITKVLDGDTFEFLAEGASRPTRVRLLGVNTPEVTGQDNIHFAEDMCAGREAEAQLERLLPPGTKVQLRSQNKESTNRGRILRYVFAYDEQTGQYDKDISAIVAESGLAMWFTVDQESALSYPYRLIVQQAQRGGRGIWDPNHCGPVEQPGAQVAVTVSWDAPGTDQTNLNGEFVIVRNTGTTPVDLSGWLLRDSSLTSWYFFPSGTVLAPGDYRMVHVGSGTPGSPSPHDLYMGVDGAAVPEHPGRQVPRRRRLPARSRHRGPVLRRVPVHRQLPRSAPGRRGHRQGECRLAEPRCRRERRTRSTSSSRTGARCPSSSTATTCAARSPRTRSRRGRRSSPGKTLTVRIGKGAPTTAAQYWGRPAPLLTNAHDRVELLSNKNVVVSKRQW